MGLRVLITSSHALPHIGGIEVLIDTEIRALAAAGHSVTLVTSSIGGAGDTPTYPPGVRVVRVWASAFLRRFGLFLPLFSPWLIWVLWREVSRANVVHGHAWTAPNTVLALFFARLQGVRTILTEHNGIQARKSRLATVGFRFLVHTLGWVAVHSADRCVVVNARVMTDLRRVGGRRKPVEFIPYPIDTDLFRPPTTEERAAARRELEWEPGRKKVLFVGRLVAEKGVPLLLAALDPERYDVVFCGSGDPAILGPLPRPGVEYLPPRKRAELVKVYHAADMMVLPSFVEGFPLVAREAMACGLPTVLGYDPGYEPYRGMPLLRFCTFSPESVAEAISKAQTIPHHRAKLLLTREQWVEAVYALRASSCCSSKNEHSGTTKPQFSEIVFGTTPAVVPRVSVIMVVFYAHPVYFRQAVDSLRTQTCHELEVLILAPPSHAGADDYLRTLQDGRFRLIFCDRQLSISQLVNYALTQAKAEYVARFDADDVAEPDWLDSQINYLENNPDINLVGSWITYIDSLGEAFGTSKTPERHEDIARQLTKTSALTQSTTVFRKSTIISAGGYRFGNHSEDYELYARLVRSGHRLANQAKALVRYRVHASSITQQQFRQSVRSQLRVKQLHLLNRFGASDWLYFTIQVIEYCLPNPFGRGLHKSITWAVRIARRLKSRRSSGGTAAECPSGRR